MSDAPEHGDITYWVNECNKARRERDEAREHARVMILAHGDELLRAEHAERERDAARAERDACVDEHDANRYRLGKALEERDRALALLRRCRERVRDRGIPDGLNALLIEIDEMLR